MLKPVNKAFKAVHIERLWKYRQELRCIELLLQNVVLSGCIKPNSIFFYNQFKLAGKNSEPPLFSGLSYNFMNESPKNVTCFTQVLCKFKFEANLIFR